MGRVAKNRVAATWCFVGIGIHDLQTPVPGEAPACGKYVLVLIAIQSNSFIVIVADHNRVQRGPVKIGGVAIRNGGVIDSSSKPDGIARQNACRLVQRRLQIPWIGVAAVSRRRARRRNKPLIPGAQRGRQSQGAEGASIKSEVCSPPRPTATRLPLTTLIHS